jgi:predicted transcriptional regulator of viral defense system
MTYTRIPEGRQKLADLVAGAGDVIEVSDAARILGLDRTPAAKALARWTAQGWLRRIRRGAYVPVTLDTMRSEQVLDDPWILVPRLFTPAYIAGRSAAEHWDLTEQIFNDIVVVTAQSIRQRSKRLHGAMFSLKHVQERKIFGTRTVWRRRTKVMVSDLPRTMVDLLDDPALGGGIQQVSDCFAEYLKHKDRNDALLIEYAERLGNGAVFKRLGFLAGIRHEAQIEEACGARLTKGNVKLDPALECPKLVTRWRIWIPSGWERSTQS